MAITRKELRELYRRRARFYDMSASLYYLVGFRYLKYRKRAVRALNLRQGDTVVEVGCGTGKNFGLLEQEVGPGGRIIGVDLTDLMLEQAQKRVRRNGWRNVELVRTDAAGYGFPEGAGGILSTFAITLIPEYDRIIRRGAEALRPGGRFVVLDFREPGHWPAWLVRLAVFVTSPFGVTLDLAERRPWESVGRYLANASYEEFYWGSTYISAGEKHSGNEPEGRGRQNGLHRT